MHRPSAWLPTRRSVLAAGTAGFAAATLSRGANAGDVAKPGGTLVVVLDPEPAGLVAGISISAPAVAVSSNIFDGLVFLDETFAPRPQLAESWETSPDGLSITFRLRKDVSWHDGKPFTSADVQYSLMEVTKKTHPRGNAVFANLTAVETPDPYTAVFRFSRPSPVVWAALEGTETQILPRHLYEGTNLIANPWTAKPIGTGAFVFKEWVRGDRIVLERNPNYWDKGRPILDRIVFRTIRDAGSRTATLEAGEAQYGAMNPVSLADTERLRGSRDLTVETRGFEGSAPMYFFDFNMRRKPFDDIRVRQAFAHAIDRTALARTIWYGLAEPATGPIPSYQKAFYNPDTPQYAFDPKKAEALLEEAGLKRGPGGVRLRIDHVPCAYGDDYIRAAEFYRQTLKRIGVELRVRTFDLPTYLRVIFTDYDFDTHSAWYSAYPDPQIGVQRRYWSQAIKKGTPSSNASQIADPDLDRVIEAIQVAGDPAERNALIRRFQSVAQEKLPSINLLELKFFRVYAKNLDGISFAPFGGYQSFKTVSTSA
jgi:peptide/nickel transport system substrate-binding protein